VKATGYLLAMEFFLIMRAPVVVKPSSPGKSTEDCGNPRHQPQQNALYLGNLDARRDWGSASGIRRRHWTGCSNSITPATWFLGLAEPIQSGSSLKKPFLTQGWTGEDHVKASERYFRTFGGGHFDCRSCPGAFHTRMGTAGRIQGTTSLSW